MNSPEPNLARDDRTVAVDDTVTGVPGLKTWRGVYFFVVACFLFWVGFLVALTVFSQ
jgi:hypothetical protein